MKRSRNFWRVLTLALALVMLFAVVACEKATTNDTATTEAPQPTEAPTNAPTDPPAEKPTETPSDTPVDPPAGPATPPVVDPTKATTLEKWGDDAFTMFLPDDFLGENTIKIAGSVCEAGCTEVLPNGPTRFDLSTVPESGNSSAMGVIKLLPSESPAGTEEGIYHYYIDKNSGGSKAHNGGNALTWDQVYIRWTFTVEEAGTYKVASYHRIKADSRSGLIQFDDQDPVLISYELSVDKFDEVNDGYAGAYLYWEGFTVELAAGVHVLTYKLDPDAGNLSIHWRDIYLTKAN